MEKKSTTTTKKVAITKPAAAVAEKKKSIKISTKVVEPRTTTIAPAAAVAVDDKPKSILKKATPAATTTTEKKKTLITPDSSSQTKVSKKSASSSSSSKTTTTTTEQDDVPVITSKLITVGCYENSILGFEAIKLADYPELGNPDDLEVHLEQIFAYASHSGCIKSIASGSEYLVSSSTDETVKVYSLSKREEFGQLVKHEGFITSLKFYKNSHLIASSRDHTLSVWNVNGWDCLKQLKGHKDAVNWVSIHPSGKVALSVGKDNRFFLWDLMRGVAAHFQKTKGEPFLVEWSKSGDHFVIAYADRLVVHTADGKEVHTYPTKQPILAIHFFDDDTLVAGGDDKVISFIDYKSGKLIKQIKEIDSRIKALSSFSFDPQDTPYLVSLSSDGNIVIWNVETDMPVGFAETGARLTCLTISDVIKSTEEAPSRELPDEFKQEEEQEEEQVANVGPKMKVDIKYDQEEEEDEEMGEQAQQQQKQKTKKPKKLTEEEYIDYMLAQPTKDTKSKGKKKVGIKKNTFKGNKPSSKK
ncbi:hypothetical protein DFA_01449 [Cavenderia fasciculata]|uniref:WD40 repeat-containing protein n=1 Tax=Cavenderia fasciculata TaxID=261658 RepID=F4PST5_CACFS|nr:uncharacterized protein DFA_01449 [Cavenderia fasciculata]EGG21563.1 hypothetical protein DFA_01449 [Cavenderia fasciculata]|eukprot:XP_004359413.1 hypothetical protein DFA_01449 [Cavenderia fasciculata]